MSACVVSVCCWNTGKSIFMRKYTEIRTVLIKLIVSQHCCYLWSHYIGVMDTPPLQFPKTQCMKHCTCFGIIHVLYTSVARALIYKSPAGLMSALAINFDDVRSHPRWHFRNTDHDPCSNSKSIAYLFTWLTHKMIKNKLRQINRPLKTKQRK